MKQHSVALTFFKENWWRVFVTKHWPTRLLESLLRIISPGFWFYIYSFVESELRIEENLNMINSGFTDWSDMDRLLNLQPVNINSIDWWDRHAVRSADRWSKQVCEDACAFFDTLAPPRVRTRRGEILDPTIGLRDRLRLYYT
jgi:hypothetical protein